MMFPILVFLTFSQDIFDLCPVNARVMMALFWNEIVGITSNNTSISLFSSLHDEVIKFENISFSVFAFSVLFKVNILPSLIICIGNVMFVMDWGANIKFEISPIPSVVLFCVG